MANQWSVSTLYLFLHLIGWCLTWTSRKYAAFLSGEWAVLFYSDPAISGISPCFHTWSSWMFRVFQIGGILGRVNKTMNSQGAEVWCFKLHISLKALKERLSWTVVILKKNVSRIIQKRSQCQTTVNLNILVLVLINLFQECSKNVPKLTSYKNLLRTIFCLTKCEYRRRESGMPLSRFVTLVIAVPYLHHKLTTFVALLLWNYQNVRRYEETSRTLWGTSMNRIGDQWIETTTPIWILSFSLLFACFASQESKESTPCFWYTQCILSTANESIMLNFSVGKSKYNCWTVFVPEIFLKRSKWHTSGINYVGL